MKNVNEIKTEINNNEINDRFKNGMVNVIMNEIKIYNEELKIKEISEKNKNVEMINNDDENIEIIPSITN